MSVLCIQAFVFHCKINHHIRMLVYYLECYSRMAIILTVILTLLNALLFHIHALGLYLLGIKWCIQSPVCLTPEEYQLQLPVHFMLEAYYSPVGSYSSPSKQHCGHCTGWHLVSQSVVTPNQHFPQEKVHRLVCKRHLPLHAYVFCSTCRFTVSHEYSRTDGVTDLSAILICCRFEFLQGSFYVHTCKSICY